MPITVNDDKSSTNAPARYMSWLRSACSIRGPAVGRLNTMAVTTAPVYSLNPVSLFGAYRRALSNGTPRDIQILRDYRPSDALLFQETTSDNYERDEAVLFCTRPSWDEDALYLVKIVSTTTRGDFWNECRALFFEDQTRYVSLVDPCDSPFFYAIMHE